MCACAVLTVFQIKVHWHAILCDVVRCA